MFRQSSIAPKNESNDADDDDDCCWAWSNDKRIISLTSSKPKTIELPWALV